MKRKNFNRNTELSGIKDIATIMQFGTFIIISGGIFYILKKYGSFKFFANFGKNVKTITKAPSEFSVAEGDVIDNAVFQIDKMLGMLKNKNISKYNTFVSEWNYLKTEASKIRTKKVGFLKFYGSGKSEKELMTNKLSIFRNRILIELKKLE